MGIWQHAWKSCFPLSSILWEPSLAPTHSFLNDVEHRFLSQVMIELLFTSLKEQCSQLFTLVESINCTALTMQTAARTPEFSDLAESLDIQNKSCIARSIRSDTHHSAIFGIMKSIFGETAEWWSPDKVGTSLRWRPSAGQNLKKSWPNDWMLKYWLVSGTMA